MLKGLKKVFSGKTRLARIIQIGLVGFVGMVIFQIAVQFGNPKDRLKYAIQSNFSHWCLPKMESKQKVVNQIKRYQNEEGFKKSLRLCRKAAKKYPEIAPATSLETAHTYELMHSRQSRIIKAYRNVIQKFPDSDEAGQALLVLEKIQAKGDLSSFNAQIIEQYPDNKISGKALEELVKTTKDPIPVYQDLIKRYPDKYVSGIALAQMMNTVFAQQSNEEAQKFCFKYLVEHPKDKVQVAAYKQLVIYAQQTNNLQPVVDFSYALLKDLPNTQLAEAAKEALADINFQRGNYIESLRLRSSLEKEKGGK